jgi:hypothetical protein
MRLITLVRLSAVLAGILLLISGCAQAPQRPAWRYLQRSSVRVAILPAANRTDKAGAALVVDKAWEDSLRNAGFAIVNADSVVTFASSRGIPIGNLGKIPMPDLGRDLHVDFLLEDEIVDWGTRYRVISGVSVVSCKSRLVEARTGALVWELDWVVSDANNNNQGGGIGGLLASAITKALVDSMLDVPKQLAKQGVTIAAATQPYPGIAPLGEPHPSP